MNEKQLQQFLRERAQKEIPNQMDIRQKVYEQIGTTKTRKPTGRLGLRRVAALVVLVMVSATAVYAWQQSRIQPDPGIQAVQSQVAQIDQTQSIAVEEPLTSLNVTVDYAYADSNRVTVAYEMTGTAAADAGVQFFSNPLLTDSDGQPYYWLPTSGQWATDVQGETFTYEGIMSFDASMLTNNPSVLNLTLTIQVAYTTAEQRAEDQYAMLAGGDAIFNFTVPFNPGQTVEVAQSASAGDLSIEVQRVVIAPSLTRLDVCLSDATPFAVDAWPDWESPVSVDVNGQRVATDQRAGFTGLHGEPLTPDATCRSLAIPTSLVGQTGSWVITLNGFQNRESGQRVDGTWSFTFDVN